MDSLEVLFWLSVLLLRLHLRRLSGAGRAGLRAALAAAAHHRVGRRRAARSRVVVVAHNEARRIAARLRTCSSSTIRRDRLEIIAGVRWLDR